MTQVHKHFYVLVRTDLTIPAQLVQAVHAAYESGRFFSIPGNHIDSTVVCQVPSEQDLIKANEKMRARGIKTILFREPDMGHQATALATEAIDSDLRRYCSNYKLWEKV